MSENGAKPSGAVVAIGVAYMFLSGLGVTGGFIYFAMSRAMDLRNIEKLLAGSGSHGMEITQAAAKLLNGMNVFMSVNAFLCVFVFFAAVYFLKLREWGRRALEAATWLYIACAAAFSVYAFLSFRELHIKVMEAMVHPRHATPPETHFIPAMIGATFGFFVTASISGLLIYALRSKTVREAMT